MHTSMVTFVTDSEGVALTRQQVIDRLCQYDVYLIMKNIDLQDYNWLSDIREQHGFARATATLFRMRSCERSGWNQKQVGAT
jgi:hypothetical protein